MNISILAFALMALVTVIFLAAMVVIERKSRAPFNKPKHGWHPAPEADHPAALMERPLFDSSASPKPGTETLASNS